MDHRQKNLNFIFKVRAQDFMNQYLILQMKIHSCEPSPIQQLMCFGKSLSNKKKHAAHNYDLQKHCITSQFSTFLPLANI